MDGETWNRVREAAGAARSRDVPRPTVALVLGSGLGGLTESIADPVALPYSSLPHFPVSGAPGHAGELVFGRLAETPVVCMSGRVHLYEGYTADEVAFGVRVMHELGANTLVVTNAAGGVREDLEPGLLMALSDHINLTGRSPLIGPNSPHMGVRFPDMTAAYAPALRSVAAEVARDRGVPLVEGVYMGLLGPTYETPAEVRMARWLGADAVGMSTVMEVIAARHLGMDVLGISCITNLAAGMLPQPLTESEVLETAARVRDTFASLVVGIVARLPERDA